MDGQNEPIKSRPDVIPATQNGVGIISYLKYYDYTGRRNAKALEFALHGRLSGRGIDFCDGPATIPADEEPRSILAKLIKRCELLVASIC
jgi:hypothetical protein